MLVRNIIFSHLLSPENFSLAMTFGVILMLFEYMSNFGHELFMQQSKYGNRLSFQASIHFYLIFRGLIVAFIIYLVNPFISSFLKIPEQNINYALLAIVPLVSAFMHTDHQRLHRNHDYSLTARISISADICSIIVALIFASFWDSYWAFYISFVFRHFLGTFLSHLWALRPYLVRFKKQYLFELWGFGLPLAFAGLLRYLGSESDKAVITRYIGLDSFTSYLLVITLLIGLTNFISIGFLKIFIRRVSSQENIKQKVAIADQNSIVLLYLTFPIVLFLGQIGEDLVGFLFGNVYKAEFFLIQIICLLVSLRIINSWLTQTIIAIGFTNKILVADICRITFLFICIYYVSQYTDIKLITLAFCFGEVVHFVALTYQIRLIDNNFLKPTIRILIVTLILVTFGAFLYIKINDQLLLTKLVIVLPIIVCIVVIFLLKSVTCRKQTLSFLNETKSIFKRII